MLGKFWSIYELIGIDYSCYVQLNHIFEIESFFRYFVLKRLEYPFMIDLGELIFGKDNNGKVEMREAGRGSIDQGKLSKACSMLSKGHCKQYENFIISLKAKTKQKQNDKPNKIHSSDTNCLQKSSIGGG